MTTMPNRMRALLLLNGLGLLILAIVIGWIWFIALLGAIQLWPFPFHIPVTIADDGRAWRMAHMEGITQGLLLLGLSAGGQFILLSKRQHTRLFWSAIITTWLFTVPPIFNALLGTRGLAFGGGPFKSGMGNDVIYLFGWPPIIAVHAMLILAALGVLRFIKAERA